jgi:hypothetical protein
MIDFNTIRVIPFYGKSEEWPIWSEKFIAKARLNNMTVDYDLQCAMMEKRINDKMHP